MVVATETAAVAAAAAIRNIAFGLADLSSSGTAPFSSCRQHHAVSVWAPRSLNHFCLLSYLTSVSAGLHHAASSFCLCFCTCFQLTMSSGLVYALRSMTYRGGIPETSSLNTRVCASQIIHSRLGKLILALSGLALFLFLFHFFRPWSLFNRSTIQGHPTNTYSPLYAGDHIDWSRFAYAQYATNTIYLCNSVMFFEILHRLGSRAELLLMYPSTFAVETGTGTSETQESRLLRKARDLYGVNLQPIEVQKSE